MFYSLVVKEGYKSFQAIKLRNIFYTLLLIVVMTKIIDGGGSFNYQREREYWPCSGEPRDDGGAVSCQYDKWVWHWQTPRASSHSDLSSSETRLLASRSHFELSTSGPLTIPLSCPPHSYLSLNMLLTLCACCRVQPTNRRDFDELSPRQCSVCWAGLPDCHLS